MDSMSKQQDVRGDGEESEVASRTVQVQSKRFYLDVKQNRRGRFLKIAEVGASGRKSRVLMSMSIAAEFSEKLAGFVKAAADEGAEGDAGGRVKSESLSKDNRRYFLDLKENQRGRFLRVAQQISPSGVRSQIAIPAQGIAEIKEKLAELLEECGSDDLADGIEELPAPQSMKVDNKMFYFDVGANRRGTFLRISEVRTNFRTAVTIPDKSWVQFRDVLNDLIDKVGTGVTTDGDTADTTESS